jgi:predicted Zn-dependent peptidase
MTTISHSDAPVSAASGSGSKEDHFRIQSWPNGFRLIYKQVDRAVTHCGVIVDAGSRDDPPGQSGCAHFLEHMLFQGTKKRRSYHVLNRMDSVGGEFNASTSKEDTWLHAAFRSQYLERAAELMSDILFGATLPGDEVEKERDVILDEILSYRDQPVEALWDAFEAELFAGHPLAAPVSGSDVSVGQITRSTILHFRDRCYVPGSMVWSVVGPTPWTDVVQLADRYFGQAPARPADRPRQPVPGRAPFDLRTHADIHQVHHVLGRTVVGGDHPDRTGLSLLANHLGGPSMNNRLMLNIRERHGLAYHTECSYQPFSDVGLFTIYFATDARQHEKAEQLIAKELRDVARTKLGVRQLHELKEQMLGHIALAQDSGSDLMMGLGKSLQQFGRVEPMESVLREIDAVTASDLLRLANEVLPWDGLSHRVFLPAAAPLNGK